MISSVISGGLSKLKLGIYRGVPRSAYRVERSFRKMIILELRLRTEFSQMDKA